MQAVFHSLVGNPFCDDPGCRLYNAHWQEEVLFAQLGSGYEFCEPHAKVLGEMNLSSEAGISSHAGAGFEPAPTKATID